MEQKRPRFCFECRFLRDSEGFKPISKNKDGVVTRWGCADCHAKTTEFRRLSKSIDKTNPIV